MALKGNVETLSLVEIFEILHASGHTGTLRVSNDQVVRTLRFHRGTLYYPKHDRNAAYKIGTLLLRHTALTQEQLDRGLKIQRERKGLLGEVLVQEGFVSAADLERIISVRYKEEVFDLFLWQRASFEFVKDVLPEGFVQEVESGQALPLHPPNIVMEAANRIDEWKRIHRAIPSLKMICEETPGSAARIEQTLQDNRIDPAIARFDGRRNLASIFDLWEHTFFDAHRVVFQLLQSGLIRPLTPARITQEVKEALSSGDHAQALRLYECAIECNESMDLGLRVSEHVFGPQGIPAGAPIELSIRTTGKKALYILLGLFEQGTLGRFTVSDEHENRRVVTFTKEALGVETSGRSATPDVTQYAARRGLITPAQVDEVRAKRKATKRHVQAVLLDDGYITEEDWTRILTDKLVDEIYDVFFWIEPRVEFKNGPDAVWGQGPAGLRLQMPYAVPGFLDELLKNLDRVRRYLEEVPSVRTVFIEAPKNGAGTAELEHPEVTGLYDGRRTVNDILRIVGWARRDLLQFMHRAIEEGDIRPLTREEYLSGVDRAIEEGRFADAQTLCWSAIHSEIEPEHFHRKLDEARYAQEEALPSILEGDFHSISLADILQSLQRKRLSGTLEVSDGKRSKTIYFDQGDVYVLRVEAEKDDFAESFLGDDLMDSLGTTFGGDLVAKGLVNEEQISEELATEIKEDVWDMFLWEGAKFVFQRNTLPPEFYNPGPTTTKLMLRTDAFLLEAIRRIMEWDNLRAQIPDPAAVFRFNSPEQKMHALATKGSPELLMLVDGRRTVDEMIRISGHKRTEVYRLLVELMEETAISRMEADEMVSG